MSDLPAVGVPRFHLGLDLLMDDFRVPCMSRLDNAAIIMPPVTNDDATSLFRLSVDMDEEVDRERLQTALDHVVKRFPYLAVELRRGFFWYKFAPASQPIVVEDDPQSPCLGFDPNRPGTCMFRVRHKGRRIACEMSHLAADGKGGMRFMKTLVTEYCRLSGHPAEERHPDVYDLDRKPAPEEYEDAYVRHYKPGLPHPVMGRPAFRVPGDFLPRGDYRITTGRLKLADALAVARERNATLMELLGAVYVEGLQKIWLESAPEDRRCTEIAVEIPIDMRRYYKTETNRNFTLFSIVGEDMRLGPRSFDNILERLKYRFRLENDETTMARHITRNAHGMLHPLVRAIPLPLKDIGARILFSVLGEKYVSGIVTNLGAVDLPRGVVEHVERFEIVQPPSTATKVNLAIHSYGDDFIVTVCSLLEDKRMEDLVFGRLASLGLEASTECNF